MFDPYDRNISAMMEENEWIIPYVTEALATDTEVQNGKIDFVTQQKVVLGVALEGVVALSTYSKPKSPKN